MSAAEPDRGMAQYAARHSLSQSDGDRFVQANAVCGFVNHQSYLGQFTDDEGQVRALLNRLANGETQTLLRIAIVRIDT